MAGAGVVVAGASGMLTNSCHVVWRPKKYVPGCMLTDSYLLCCDCYDVAGRVSPFDPKAYSVTDYQLAFSGCVGSIS